MARMMIAAACFLCLAAPAAAGNWRQSPSGSDYYGSGATQPHFGGHPRTGGNVLGSETPPPIGNGANLDPYWRCIHDHPGTPNAMANCQPGTGAWNGRGAVKPPFGR